MIRSSLERTLQSILIPKPSLAAKENKIPDFKMAAGSNKVPPALSKNKTYDVWIKALTIWSKFTDLPRNKQGPAVFLSLEGEAQEVVLELAEDVITSDGGVKHIIERLDNIYKKDELLKKYEALEALKLTSALARLLCKNYLTNLRADIIKPNHLVPQ